jgi:acyl-CoA synthetase (AMP-forming)/AMP-acid ligase II
MTKTSLIHHFLEKSAQQFPEKEALIHEKTRATYRQIDESANRLANGLLDLGILPGDRTAILMENGLGYVVSYYAILKAGGVAVPLSTGLKPDSLNPLLAELKPKIIITSKKFERLLKASDTSLIQNSKIIIQDFSSVLNPQNFEIIDFDELVSSYGFNKPTLSISKNALASIIYTSGSTGKPKGVMLTHENIVTNTQSICSYLELTPNDIQMVVLPFFYVMGQSLLNTHMAVGGTVVINNKFAFPASVLNQMVDERVTGFSGVPSTYAFLLHRSPLGAFRDKLESLRYCTQAGGHMSQRVKTALRKTLPDHTDIFIMYGATEASARLTYLAPEFYNSKKGSIGKPIPGVKLSIINPEGNEVRPGEKGELVAHGLNIMKGYWKDSTATARVLDKDGYHTGDVAYQDKDGFYYISGRKDNLIKSGGHRINPQEIEDCLMETGLVMEVAVMGIADPLLGSRLVAIVEPTTKDITPEVILKQCSDMLPKYKLPTQLLIVRAVPKKKSGKIDREKCMDLLLKVHQAK